MGYVTFGTWYHSKSCRYVVCWLGWRLRKECVNWDWRSSEHGGTVLRLRGLRAGGKASSVEMNLHHCKLYHKRRDRLLLMVQRVASRGYLHKLGVAPTCSARLLDWVPFHLHWFIGRRRWTRGDRQRQRKSLLGTRIWGSSCFSSISTELDMWCSME